MSDGTRLEQWVRLQRKTWDVDAQARASRITVERGHDEVVQSFPAELEDLGRCIQDCLNTQAEELPAGAHQFRAVSYDPTGKQLGELPQTVKGRNKDATAAGQQALSNQRANAMAVDSLSFVLDKFRVEMEQQSNRLGDLFDDVTALSSSNAEMRLSNEEAMLRRLEFERRQERWDKIFDAVGSIATMVVPPLVEKFAPKLLGMTSEDMVKKAAAALDKLTEPTVPPTPESKEGTLADVKSETAGPTTEPIGAIVPVVAQPRPGTLQGNTQGRGKGNLRPVPGKRGSKAPPTKTTKRK